MAHRRKNWFWDILVFIYKSLSGFNFPAEGKSVWYNMKSFVIPINLCYLFSDWSILLLSIYYYLLSDWSLYVIDFYLLCGLWLVHLFAFYLLLTFWLVHLLAFYLLFAFWLVRFQTIVAATILIDYFFRYWKLTKK